MHIFFEHRTKRMAGCFAAALALVLFFIPAAAFADFSHEVVSGDTLWDIAVKYDVSISELMTANGIGDDDILSIGRTLTIPSEYDFDYTRMIEHKVKSGECLSVIAGNYDVAVAEIAEFNGLEPDDPIFINQVLSIPPKGAVKAGHPAGDGEIYTVRPGDSAWLIARNYDISTERLLEYNGLTEQSILTVGQRLRIPPGAGGPIDRGIVLSDYTVRPGDCLSIIADKHDITTSYLCELNNIDISDYVHPGQKLKVPGRPAEPPPAASNDQPAKKRAPVVVAEDIDDYNGGALPPITVKDVESAAKNAVDSSVFDFTSRQEEFSINGYYDGTDTYYRIEPGDCVSYIADCFDLGIDDICAASKLTDVDYIIPGQIIKLPGKHDVSALKNYKDDYVSTGGKALMDACLDHLGVKYVYGGEDLNRGVDCSGLIWAIVRRDYGISLPRSAKDLSNTDRGIEVDYDDLQPGDMVFFHTTRPGISHVGVYMGSGKFVHASSAKGKVCIGRMDTGYYNERFIKALRLDFLK